MCTLKTVIVFVLIHQVNDCRVIELVVGMVDIVTFLEPHEQGLLDSGSLEPIVDNIVQDLLTLHKVVQEGLSLIVVIN